MERDSKRMLQMFYMKNRKYIITASKIQNFIVMQMHYSKIFKKYHYCNMAQLRKEDIILREKIKLRLTELREKHGQNKTELSSKVEVDRQNFQAWEKHDIKRGPTIYSINRISKAFGISLKEFFDSDIFKTEKDA
ncbi:helix-turn-helix transcriptional regulator [Flavobacterium acetivorans]|uniref:helix-turn-helix transcriptional regulator n=1 Tax=Flavobacterium acetivorans TaxID=2893883 RepID=UPI001E2E9842|nr:helix-turn-helix transcriptional regulator [Flavobacterium sp. F-29]UFH34707.1 helix-turn-helix transcriptional regulator [Flavobacterium sp. F-29]